MKSCTYSGTLDELLARPTDLLVLKGAEEDGQDDAGGGGQDDDQGKDDKTGQGGGAGGADDKTGESKEKDDQKGKESRTLSEDDWRVWTNFKDERDRVHGEKRAAIQRAEDAERELNELKSKGVTDEQAKSRLTDLETENGNLKTKLSDLALENQFLKDNTYEWIDPEAALRLADLKNVEVKDDGTVTGLKVALDALAKDRAYLLKPKQEQRQQRKSGDPAGGNGGGSSKADKQVKENKLRSKYGIRR